MSKTVNGLAEILMGDQGYFLLPVAYDNARNPVIPHQLGGSRPLPLSLAGLGEDPACDEYWTEQNAGICSDEFGAYLRPDGTPVSAAEIIGERLTPGIPRPPPPAGGDLMNWVKARSPIVLLAAGLFGLLWATQGGRR
jgi:hypothetical protein